MRLARQEYKAGCRGSLMEERHGHRLQIPRLPGPLVEPKRPLPRWLGLPSLSLACLWQPFCSWERLVAYMSPITGTGESECEPVPSGVQSPNAQPTATQSTPWQLTWIWDILWCHSEFLQLQILEFAMGRKEH